MRSAGAAAGTGVGVPAGTDVEVNLTDAEVTTVVQPKDDPQWRFALAARPEAASVVVKLTASDGTVGYGTGGEIPHLGYDIGELADTAEGGARSIASGQPATLNAALDKLAALRRECPPAFCALEMALFDLTARRTGQRVSGLLGGQVRQSVPVLRILGIKKPEEMAAAAKARIAEGYRYLKIKVDNESLETDADRIAAVREAVGPDVGITVDANQSYAAADAIRLYRRAERYHIDLFEQPVPSRDFDGLKLVTRELPCLVEADESAHSMADVIALLNSHAVDAISLKLGKMGGIRSVHSVARICEDVGVKVRLGAHVGNRLLSSVALNVAVTLPALGYACELGEFNRLLEDPFTGLEVSSGELSLPDGPGAGVMPRAAQDSSPDL